MVGQAQGAGARTRELLPFRIGETALRAHEQERCGVDGAGGPFGGVFGQQPGFAFMPISHELVERERVTQFVGVPTMTIDLLESPDFPNRDTSSLASVGGGGAPAPPEMACST